MHTNTRIVYLTLLSMADAFIQACKHGQVQEVAHALTQLNAEEPRPRYFWKGLDAANRMGHMDVLYCLLDMSPGPGFRSTLNGSWRPFRFYPESEDAFLMFLTLQGPWQLVQDEVDAAFVTACQHGCLRVVRALLAFQNEVCEHGVNVHAMDDMATRKALLNGHVDVVRELLTLKGARKIDIKHIDDTYMFGRLFAKVTRSVEMVKFALAGGFGYTVDPEAFKSVALTNACWFGSIEAAKVLLNLNLKYIGMSFVMSTSDLFTRVCGYGRVEMARHLLTLPDTHSCHVWKEGVEVGFANACIYGKPDVVELLLELNDSRRLDLMGWEVQSSLQSAERFGHLAVAQAIEKARLTRATECASGAG